MDENRKIVEAVSTIANARAAITRTQSFVVGEADSVSGATVGAMAVGHGNDIHVMPVTHKVNKATGTVTKVPVEVGKITSDESASKAYDFDVVAPNTTYKEGRMYYDPIDKTMFMYSDKTSYIHRLGRGTSARAINGDTVRIEIGTAVHFYDVHDFGGGMYGPYFDVKKASALDWDENFVVGVTATAADPGEFVEVIFNNVISGIDTSSLRTGVPLYLGVTPGSIVDVRPAYPAKPVVIGGVSVPGVNGAISVIVKDDVFDPSLDGSALSEASITIVAEGGVVYADVRNVTSPASGLAVQLDSGYYFLNCQTGSGVGGAARVALTSGTTTTAAFNYIYVTLIAGVATLMADTLTPTGSYALIGTTVLKDYDTTQLRGPLAKRVVAASVVMNGKGRITTITEKLSSLGTSYVSGIEGTFTITPTAGIDNVLFSTTAGVGYRLLDLSIPSKSLAANGAYVLNASGIRTLTQLQYITNLGLLLETSTGTPIVNNDRFSLTVYMDVGTGDGTLLIALPSGKYTSDELAYADSYKYSDYSVPDELSQTCIPLFRIPLKYTSAGGGTLSFVGSAIGRPTVVDLRGSVLGSGSSGDSGIIVDSEFSIINSIDATKRMQFNLSGVPTNTTVTLNVPAASGTIVTDNYSGALSFGGNLTSGGVNSFNGQNSFFSIVRMPNLPTIPGAIGSLYRDANGFVKVVL